MPLFLAAPLSALIALVAWGARALTGWGAVAAAAVGTAVLTGTGWPGGLVLAVFFVSSTAVSHALPDPAIQALDARGNRRDPVQVLANGVPAALGALLGLHVPGLGLWVVTSSLAAAAADTWATAWGATSPRPPRAILSGKTVPAGTSGGITLRGCVGAAGGAALVGLTGAVAGSDEWLFGAGFLVGLGGMLADSALGDGWQGKFYCEQCARATERRIHRCGTPALHRRGWIWLTNDGVNALVSALAALTGWAAWLLASRS
ncbi:MAG: DUF92 domain-containing protein [Gemmatimonadales bacterium]